jgi:hypothetical protein
MLIMTSGEPLRTIAIQSRLDESLVRRCFEYCLHPLAVLFEQRLPTNASAVIPTLAFVRYEDVFGIVDPTPIYIQRPKFDNQRYYSGKFKRHCVKIQALVTAEGQCVHRSRVFPGTRHDKGIFDESGILDFITTVRRTRHQPPVRQSIMADLGYAGIQRTCPNAVLPIKRHPGKSLTSSEKKTNRSISRIRVFVENYFGRWKALFGIIAFAYRGELRFLEDIVAVTLGITNWYIERHPLRRLSDSDEPEAKDDAHEAEEATEEDVETRD